MTFIRLKHNLYTIDKVLTSKPKQVSGPYSILCTTTVCLEIHRDVKNIQSALFFSSDQYLNTFIN